MIALTALLMLGVAGTASAVEYRLRAEAALMTMPDGAVVAMWGFAQDKMVFGRLVRGPVTVPGPVLTVPPGDSTLTILLENNLPVPVSIVIPGQTTVMSPVKVNGRVRSFTHETSSGNDVPVEYTWTSMKPGTYLYQSGTDPSVQVQMGLYGAVKKNFAAGKAYNASPAAYTKDVILLFSEVDPALHEAVVSGNYGAGMAVTSTMDYVPKYFLVNGTPFSPGIDAIPSGTSSSKVLIRFLNAGLHDHIPAFPDVTVNVIAEDGNLLPAPREQTSVILPAGKTMDAVITKPAAGYYALFDRRGYLSNGGTSPGGMLTYLKIATLYQYTLSVSRGVWTAGDTGSGAVIAAGKPAGISCGANCTASYNQGTSITLQAIPAPGSIFYGWRGACSGTGDCTVVMNSNKSVKALFANNIPRITVSPTMRNFGPIGAGTLSMPQRFTIKNSGVADLNIASIGLGGANAAEFILANNTCQAAVASGATCTVDVIFAPATAGSKTATLDIASNAPGSPKQVTLGGSGVNQKVGVLSPNGREVWAAGSAQTIEWRADPTVTGMNLYFTTNNGFTWTLINKTGKITGATTYPWTVPTPAATRTQCRVKVTGYTGATAVGTDVSNGLFTIQVP
jgi:FtsP/CotA-like multicopper oxidase with cupredoxin domain